MSGQELLTEVDGSVLILTMNRPGQRNAVNGALAESLSAAMDEFEARADLSVVVLTGADRNFCSGMDLKAFLAGEHASMQGRGFAGITERRPTKPLIAAVEGCAVGGGLELMLACDLVVAAEGAWFALPEVQRGMVARSGGLLRLPERLPRAIATEMILTGTALDAAEARAFGLVNRVVESGGALEAAVTLAGKIAENAPLAVRLAKRVLDESPSWPPEERFDRQRKLSEPVIRSADAWEGACAFAEKRPPRWTGS